MRPTHPLPPSRRIKRNGTEFNVRHIRGPRELDKDEYVTATAVGLAGVPIERYHGPFYEVEIFAYMLLDKVAFRVDLELDGQPFGHLLLGKAAQPWKGEKSHTRMMAGKLERAAFRKKKREMTVDGKTIAEWAEIQGLSENAIYVRMQRGWSLEKSCRTPKGPGGRKRRAS